jgi:DNA-binding NarL/FixJ family response regulator
MLMAPCINGRTYEKIIKNHPDQKAIIISGFSEGDDVKAVIQLGANGYIKKPYAMKAIGRVVKDAFNPYIT